MWYLLYIQTHSLVFTVHTHPLFGIYCSYTPTVWYLLYLHTHCVVFTVHTHPLYGIYCTYTPTVWYLLYLHTHCVVFTVHTHPLYGIYCTYTPTVWYLLYIHTHCVVFTVLTHSLCGIYCTYTLTEWYLLYIYTHCVVFTVHTHSLWLISNKILLLFYILAASDVISGRVPTCDRMHSWWLYCAASLGQQAARTMTCYPTQSHYPDTEPTCPCSILIMPKYQTRKRQVSIVKSLLWLHQKSNPWPSDSLICQHRRQTLYSFSNNHISNKNSRWDAQMSCVSASHFGVSLNAKTQVWTWVESNNNYF